MQHFAVNTISTTTTEVIAFCVNMCRQAMLPLIHTYVFDSAVLTK